MSALKKISTNQKAFEKDFHKSKNLSNPQSLPCIHLQLLLCSAEGHLEEGRKLSLLNLDLAFWHSCKNARTTQNQFWNIVTMLAGWLVYITQIIYNKTEMTPRDQNFLQT